MFLGIMIAMAKEHIPTISEQEIEKGDFRIMNSEIYFRNPRRIRSDGSAVTLKIEQCQSELFERLMQSL